MPRSTVSGSAGTRDVEGRGFDGPRPGCSSPLPAAIQSGRTRALRCNVGERNATEYEVGKDVGRQGQRSLMSRQRVLAAHGALPLETTEPKTRVMHLITTYSIS